VPRDARAHPQAREHAENQARHEQPGNEMIRTGTGRIAVNSNSGALSHSKLQGRLSMRMFGVWIQCQCPSSSQCNTRGTRQLKPSWVSPSGRGRR